MTPMSFVAQQAQTGGGRDVLATVLPILLMVAIFYFLLVRPQQRRVRQQRDLMEGLGVGDEVVTIGGLFGTILEMDDESITIDAGGGTRLRFLKQAVARKFVEEPDTLDEEAGGES